MSLQNHVDPYGQLHAVDARGAWMGNRGVLHSEAKEIVAPWRGKRWITCVLEFRGRKRNVFTPGRYSELHAERTGGRTQEAAAAELPAGTFVDMGGRPFLVWGKLFPWTFEAYGAPVSMPRTKVRVLTPRSILKLFRGGLRPQVHPSAGQRAR